MIIIGTTTHTATEVHSISMIKEIRYRINQLHKSTDSNRSMKIKELAMLGNRIYALAKHSNEDTLLFLGDKRQATLAHTLSQAAHQHGF